MVRRGRDQRHALGAVAQPGDQLGHLHARKLAALAGLCPLRDLDFQLFTGIQVFGSHTKAARGNLLDLGRRVVAVGFRQEMRRVFAALAAVGLGPDAVHCHVQRLVRLGRQGAKAHARSHETLSDRGDRFHFLYRHRLAQCLDVQQVADMDRRVRPHRGRILLPQIIAGPVASRLQQVHRLRFPSVLFARPPRLVKAANRQHIAAAQPATGVNLFQLLLNAVQADARNPAVHAGEIFGHQGAGQTHRLEVQAPAIGRDHRDAHLGHDLQKARINGVAIAAHRIQQAALQQAAVDPVGNGILRKIGVDRGSATTDQNREIMRIDTFGRPHVDRTEGPQALARQPAMHRAGGQDHRHPDLAFALMFVGQNQLARARAHGIFSLRPNTLQRHAQVVMAGTNGEGAVDIGHLRAETLNQNIEFGIGDKGAFQHQDLGLRRVFIEHVLEVAEPGFQAHHPAFTQGVDGRVGHLAEVLAEEMRQRAIDRRQNRRRRIVAHRGDHFLAVFGHRGQYLLQLLDGVTRRNLALAQISTGIDGALGHIFQQRVQIDDLAHPVAIGLAGSQTILDLGIVVKLAIDHIDGYHLSRSQRALFAHRGFVHRHHPGLGPGNQHPIAGDDIAHGPQAVAVKPAADPAAIGHGQRRRAVPRFHNRVAIGIHIGPCLGHIGRGLRPRLWHQHGFRHGGRTARTHQHLEHRIQRARVRGATGDDRLDVLCHVAESRRSHADLMAAHPVDVALQCVDLAVMGQHAEGLRQPPLRESVGGVALMINGKGGFKPLIRQIGVEHRHLLGQHHPLVNDAAAREGTQVKPLNPRRRRRLFDAAADDVQFALELLGVGAILAANQDLFDLGARRIGLFAQNGRVHRDMPPAIDVMAHPQDFGFHDGPAAFLRAEIGTRKENLPHRDQLFRIRLMPGAANLIVEELDRNLHMDARAVASLAVGIHCTPVPDRLKRRNAVFHNLAAGLAGNRHHQSHPARGMLVIRLVETVRIQPGALFFLCPYPGFIIDRHGLLLRAGGQRDADGGAVQQRHLKRRHLGVAVKNRLGGGKAFFARLDELHRFAVQGLPVGAIPPVRGAREKPAPFTADVFMPARLADQRSGIVNLGVFILGFFQGHAVDRHGSASQLVIAGHIGMFAVVLRQRKVEIIAPGGQQRRKAGWILGVRIKRLLDRGVHLDAFNPLRLGVDMRQEEQPLLVEIGAPLVALGVGLAGVVVGHIAAARLHGQVGGAALGRGKAAGMGRSGGHHYKSKDHRVTHCRRPLTGLWPARRNGQRLRVTRPRRPESGQDSPESLLPPRVHRGWPRPQAKPRARCRPRHKRRAGWSHGCGNRP